MKGSLRAEGGFTLIEVLVALFVLGVGVSGLLALFNTGVGLQKEAVERMDVALILPGILRSVEDELSDRSEGPRDLPDAPGEERPVPGHPAYAWRVRLHEDPSDPSGRVVLCRVEILAPPWDQGRVYSFPYLPIVPQRSNDARIRALLE